MLLRGAVVVDAVLEAELGLIPVEAGDAAPEEEDAELVDVGVTMTALMASAAKRTALVATTVTEGVLDVVGVFAKLAVGWPATAVIFEPKLPAGTPLSTQVAPDGSTK